MDQNRTLTLCWAPARSDAVSRLCRELNGREKAGLFALSLMFGFCAFAFMVILLEFTLGIGPFPDSLGGYAFPALVCLSIGAWVLLALQRQLLLGSRAAKEIGVTNADLGPRQSMSRRDYLALGGFVALAVTVALGAILIVA